MESARFCYKDLKYFGVGSLQLASPTAPGAVFLKDFLAASICLQPVVPPGARLLDLWEGHLAPVKPESLGRGEGCAAGRFQYEAMLSGPERPVHGGVCCQEEDLVLPHPIYN